MDDPHVREVEGAGRLIRLPVRLIRLPARAFRLPARAFRVAGIAKGKPGTAWQYWAMRRILVVWLALALFACSSPEPSSLRTPSRAAQPSRSPSATAWVPALTVAVLGDWGAGTPQQRAVAERMCATRRQTPFRTVVTVGDNFYPRGTATRKTFWDPAACLLSPPAVEWKAAWGNHDLGGESTADVLGAKDRMYVWSTPQADFFFLDSNRSASLAQRDWLAGSLAASRAAVKIAVFHHPAWAGGSEYVGDPFARRLWAPLFERYGVRLVLSGHAHNYQHARVRGVHYVVSGGGGAALYRCNQNQSWLLRCDTLHQFLLVTVSGTSVSVSAIDVTGKRFDEFTIG